MRGKLGRQLFACHNRGPAVQCVYCRVRVTLLHLVTTPVELIKIGVRAVQASTRAHANPVVMMPYVMIVCTEQFLLLKRSTHAP